MILNAGGMVVLDVGRLGFIRGLDCKVRWRRAGWEDFYFDLQKWRRGWGKAIFETRRQGIVRKRIGWTKQSSRCVHMEAFVDEVAVRGRAMGVEKSRVIVISGPTAVGKTQVALMLAKRLDGEIISADSVQVYKGLDVGSAKTPLDRREGVPHHLLDLVHPTKEYAAGDFFDDAREATADVLSRGRVPIVVGGTGLYLRWYLHGTPGTPRATEELTASVDAELSQLQIVGDWNAAVQLLARAGDAETAYSLSRNDWYRLRRALLIVKASGFPRSCFPHVGKSPKSKLVDSTASTGHYSQDEQFSLTSTKDLDYDFRCYFLNNNRLDLYHTIDLRCEEMLTEVNGLLAEASWLLDLGMHPSSSSPSRAIGYRQAMEYLAQCRKSGGTSSEEEFFSFLSSFQQASRNYAKRQLTWFRSEPRFRWIDASQSLEHIIEYMVDDYHKPDGIVIDSQVRLLQQVSSKKEMKLLKGYQTTNRTFINSQACAPILDWIKRTQGDRIQNGAASSL
ncbi:hypothetical protein O6H91_19G046900 [Diphasiastrum complanatum]|uniref:Uncharacterized protein n=1 Tax=Diphasiastrum complanatum TaxID=34168 RepID=A0ACC2AW97_DIPCM|nr:hypothetical protein O6H91_19G046900 [Diphasiastrum complanatum]